MDEISFEGMSGSPAYSPRKIQPRGMGENSFSEMVKSSLTQVNNLQKEADQAIHGLVVANEKDIHETMIAMEKADISFKLVMTVRNKLIGAYEEIMRMNI